MRRRRHLRIDETAIAGSPSKFGVEKFHLLAVDFFPLVLKCAHPWTPAMQLLIGHEYQSELQKSSKSSDMCIKIR